MSSPSAEDSSVGEISWLTNDFLEGILKNSTDGSEEIVILSKYIERAVGKAENYLSILYRVKVQYKQGRSDENHTSHLIVKAVPGSEYMEKKVNSMGVFARETDIYHIVLPQLYMFAKERMANEVLPTFTARYYPTTRNNTLVLDDLAQQGFRMADRKTRLDLEHCRLVVKSLAKLHGISAALHQQNPSILAKYNDIMWCAQNRDMLLKFIPKQLKNISDVSKNWEGIENISSKLTRILPNAVDKFIEVSEVRQNDFQVLNHGDCWINNMLFKYSPKGEPTDLRFVDLQLSRMGSPALDLSYFMYSSPRNAVREQHMDELLREYHAQLCLSMKNSGVENKVFTLQNLQAAMKQKMFFGFVTSVVTLGVMLSQAEDMPDLNTLKEGEVPKEGLSAFFRKTQNSTRFEEAFKPLLLYFDEFGVFD